MLSFLTVLAFAAAAVFVAREADIECDTPRPRRTSTQRPAKDEFFDAVTSAR